MVFSKVGIKPVCNKVTQLGYCFHGSLKDSQLNIGLSASLIKFLPSEYIVHWAD